MLYKLVITEEMERLLDEHVRYLVNKLGSNQAAEHLIGGVEEIYRYLEKNPRIFHESQEPFLNAFHYREAKIKGMDYIIVYKICDSVVYILGIFNCLENYSNKIKIVWSDMWL